MSTSTTRRPKPETPVEIFTSRDGNDAVYKTNIEHEPTLQKILDSYDVESVDALAGQFLPTGREILRTHRLGIVNGSQEGAEFIREDKLLALTEDFTHDLASGLVAWYGDIPSLCEELRRDGVGTLYETLSDAGVEGKEWTNDLRYFFDSVGETQDSVEQRLKDAGVWVEPDNVSAGR